MSKNTQSKKETKGTLGSWSCQTGRLLYQGCWRDAHRLDGMAQCMFPRRMALKHLAYGKPEASATVRSLG